MEVLLLGTGSHRGWPEPGCRCASCAGAGALRRSRGSTWALVDDLLLLDPGPDAARAAAGYGRALTAARTVLRTAPGDGLPGARLLGPPEVAPGREVTAGGHRLRALPQGDQLAWEITGRDGRRLLYAPGRAPVRAPGSYDLLVLGLDALAPTLRAGASGGDVVAVGLGHDDPPVDERDRRLAAWGARAVDDGTLLVAGQAPAAQPIRGRTLVLGGARSGKSALAEQLLAACPQVTYVATGGRRDGDEEWAQRVAAHVRRRPSTWRTVETADVAGCLRRADGPLLVDCLGTWLTGRLDAHGVWDGGSEQPVAAEVADLLAAWRQAAAPVVAVSNEVGSGVVPATTSGRRFRDLLGRLNAAVAAQSETVLLTVAGIAVPLREPWRG